MSRDAEEWKAEFRIPFSQLRFETGKRDTFGFGVIREIGRLNETSPWPLIATSRPGFVSQVGELGGLKRVEVVRYGVAQMPTQPVEAGNPFEKSPDPGGAVGVDLKYTLTPGLTMTATSNPDFGQVEADPAVVDLTAFETFCPARRPFFVESSGNLTFDLDCNDGASAGRFHSWRMGRQPHGSPDVPAGEVASAPPTPAAPISATSPSAAPMSCAGSSSPDRRSTSCGSREGKTSAASAASAPGTTSGASSASRRATCSWRGSRTGSTSKG